MQAKTKTKVVKCPRCSKKGYRTVGMAVGAALRSSRRSGKGIRYYYNRECHFYHLTSMAKANW